MYRSYHYLRPFAVFAGIIGAIQALAWMAMAIVGIIAYYCHFSFVNHLVRLSSMLDFTFYRLYFEGDCVTEGFPPGLSFGALTAVNTMPAIDIHAWMWVYLVVSFFWFISSLTLITNVKMDYIKFANIFLYVWIFITIAISVLDLALGILFGLDYNALTERAQDFLLNTISINHLVIANAQVAAGIMMTVAFRGWIIWLANVLLALYFFRETFNIYDYNKMAGISSAGQSNSAFAEPHSILKTHPIDAYATNNNNAMLNNRWNISNGNQDVRRERTRSFSGTPSGFDDRARPVQSVDIAQQPQLRRYQQPPPPPPPQQQQQQQHQQPNRDDNVILRRDTAASLAREARDRRSYNEIANRPMVHMNDPNLPAPDYSPPMMRAYDNRPPLRPVLRNSRYQ